MTTVVSQRTVKVSKTDAVGIDVSSWLDGGTIASLTVTDESGLTTVGATQINGGVLTVLITGVTEGAAELHFNYATASRSDCAVLIVPILADC